jgi:hypothetical protein
MIKLRQLINLTERTGEERTRKEFVLTLSRDIINAFKSGQTKLEDYFELSGERSEDETPADVKLLVKFRKRPKQEYAYSISADADGTKQPTRVNLAIDFNPAMFPNAMNGLIAEIKETLEHEFEHVLQQSFYKSFVVSNKYDEPLTYPPEGPTAPSHFLYLTSNAEVPAYIKGLLKRAKVKRMTFDQALEDYYSDYRDTFRDEGTNWSAVKAVWKDWAMKNKDKLKKAL